MFDMSILFGMNSEIYVYWCDKGIVFESLCFKNFDIE